ncbi:hypothetical protein OHA18_28545 [Kribbella sp. NBC_00709]|uniref:hypothetical protein n=1 Tax=Kribbella sp. NBC_00709 TaxID=2975972 RepID=UPI002E2E7D16|nr:hypothetical protein [Kribbella sp. NBC_00709]
MPRHTCHAGLVSAVGEVAAAGLVAGNAAGHRRHAVADLAGQCERREDREGRSRRSINGGAI